LDFTREIDEDIMVHEGPIVLTGIGHGDRRLGDAEVAFWDV
jgi:hypothetical protein